MLGAYQHSPGQTGPRKGEPCAMITVDRTLTAGAWVGDPVHSDISFKVRHRGGGE